MEKKFTMEELVAFLKNQGYVYQGSEIYGGLANAWDYGPLGVELLNNIKKMWWKKFVQESKTNVGLDAAILMNPRVWVASGHVGGFSDPLIDCKSCGVRYRADKLIEDFTQGKETGDGWDNDKLMAFVTLEDLYGTAEVIAFENAYLKAGKSLVEENIVMVERKVKYKRR